MMVSLVWYYRPEHTERGRQSTDAPDEVFASRHRDANSVACIEDKCYVLTFNEYCRWVHDLLTFRNLSHAEEFSLNVELPSGYIVAELCIWKVLLMTESKFKGSYSFERT